MPNQTSGQIALTPQPLMAEPQRLPPHLTVVSDIFKDMKSLETLRPEVFLLRNISLSSCQIPQISSTPRRAQQYQLFPGFDAYDARTLEALGKEDEKHLSDMKRLAEELGS